MTRSRALLIGIALLLLLPGCGIRGEGEARRVQPPPGPYSDLTRPPVDVTQPGPVSVILYLARGGALTTVTRQVPEPSLTSLMENLLAGPTDAEQNEGINSALTGANVIGDVVLVDGQARVDLATGLDGTGRSDAVLAIAQVVCTLDARPEVTGVVFTREGDVVAVPRGDGALHKGPLTSPDYSCPSPD